MDCFIKQPRRGEVYNLGGGRANSVSILEAFALAEGVTGKPMKYEYHDQNRKGDHVGYISNPAKMQRDYPNWKITRGLEPFFEEIGAAWKQRV